MNIVIAEDEFLIADMLAISFEEAGHEVRIAPHGLAALELVKEQKPDIVITDFMMPLMTGLELAEAIRADADLKDLPIILVSGAQAGIARGRSELFDMVSDKPYAISKLLVAAEELVQPRL